MNISDNMQPLRKRPVFAWTQIAVDDLAHHVRPAQSSCGGMPGQKTFEDVGPRKCLKRRRLQRPTLNFLGADIVRSRNVGAAFGAAVYRHIVPIGEKSRKVKRLLKPYP